jgi:hypothetical protein
MIRIMCDQGGVWIDDFLNQPICDRIHRQPLLREYME